MKLFVTGGQPYQLQHYQHSAGPWMTACEVVAVDNFQTGRSDNLAQHESNGKLKLIEGSITDLYAWRAAIEGVANDTIIHTVVMPDGAKAPRRYAA